MNIKRWRRYMKGLRHSRALIIEASSKEAVSYVWNPEVIRGILCIMNDSGPIESEDVVDLYHTLVPIVQRELQFARMRIDETVLSTIREYAHKYKEANDA